MTTVLVLIVAVAPLLYVIWWQYRQIEQYQDELRHVGKPPVPAEPRPVLTPPDRARKLPDHPTAI